MFNYFKMLSLSRKAWSLLILSCIGLEATALYFQHGMGLNPCVMCIYERLALFAILLSGVIGFLFSRFFVPRMLALCLGLYSSAKGLLIAITHTDYQLHPAPWKQCALIPDFPATLPLHEWFPKVFAATGSCNAIEWQLWGVSMPQWLIAIFSVYFAIFVLISLSQIKRIKPRNRNLFR